MPFPISLPTGPNINTLCTMTVGTGTRYESDGPGIESRWRGGDFPLPSDRAWGPPSLLHNRVPGHSGGKKRPGRGVTTHFHKPPRLKKE